MQWYGGIFDQSDGYTLSANGTCLKGDGLKENLIGERDKPWSFWVSTGRGIESDLDNEDMMAHLLQW